MQTIPLALGKAIIHTDHGPVYRLSSSGYYSRRLLYLLRDWSGELFQVTQGWLISLAMPVRVMYQG